MATDGSDLSFNPDFVATLSDEEIKGVIAHEVMHCAYQHHTRRGKRDPEQWNIAADYAINRDLRAAGIVLPDCALFDPRFEGLGSEEIYSLIAAEQEDGQGNNPGNDPGQCGQILDAAPASDPGAMAQAQATWETRTRQAVAIAKAHNEGSVPGALVELLEALNAPAVDWRTLLRQFIDQSTHKDYTWSQPNRRFIAQGMYLPGTIPDGMAHLVTCVDTSGSIDKETLNTFGSELQAILDETAIDKLTIVYTDTKVQAHQSFEQGDELVLEPAGGGGTDFRECMEWLNRETPDANAIVFFSDMDVRSFGDEPSAPVLWAAYGHPAFRKPAPFGQTVAII